MKIVSSNTLIKLVGAIKSKFATKTEVNNKFSILDTSVKALENKVSQLDVIYEDVEG